MVIKSKILWRGLPRKLKLKFAKSNLTKKKQKSSKTKREIFRPIPGKSIVFIKKFVLSLQSQIAVELRSKNSSKANSLIRKLLKSKEAQALAVYNTITATGYRSKGLSKIKPKTNTEYRELMHNLWLVVKSPKTYKASPLKRTYVEKVLKPGQPPPFRPPDESSLKFTDRTKRPISVPTYFDRALQHLYKFVLEVICEEIQAPTSFGFRPFRSAPWASRTLILAIWSRKGFGPPKFALELDIKKFYDSISPDWLIKNCTSIKVHGETLEVIPPDVMAQWLHCGFICSDFVSEGVIPTTGIPQGGPICPVIANVVLNGIEDHIKDSIASAEPPPARVIPQTHFIYKVSYQGKPFAIVTGVKSYKEIDNCVCEQIKENNLSLYYHPKSASIILSDSSPNRSLYGWSIVVLKGDSLNLNKRRAANNSWSFVVRFADDITLLFNNQDLQPLIFKSAQDFLTPRGLNLNIDKCKFVDLYRKQPCLFVGINHAYVYQKGKGNRMRIYSFPPPGKVTALRRKIASILRDPSSTNESIFNKINPILRGWCNYYSSSNSSKCFSKLSHWLWHKMYYFFTKRYKKLSAFRRKSQRHFKSKLSAFIWNKHLIKFPHSNTKWWKVPLKEQRISLRKKNPRGLFLYYPKKVKIIYPLLIYNNPDETSLCLGLNAFHPMDRIELETKALGWRRGVQYEALRKTNGHCALCDITLVDCSAETILELHHCKPIYLGGRFSLPNLLPLCKHCHFQVSGIVKRKDISAIKELEQKGILNGVSDAFALLKEETPPESPENFFPPGE
jgi:retron-type reverse transcriptase